MGTTSQLPAMLREVQRTAASAGKVSVETRAPTVADGEGKPENAMWNEINPTTGEQVATWRWDGAAWANMPLNLEGATITKGLVTAEIREAAQPGSGLTDLISKASLGAFPLQTHTDNALWPALRFEAAYEGQPARSAPAHIHGASSGSLTFAPGSKPNPTVGQFYQSGTGSISSSQFNFRVSDAKLTSWYDYGNGTGMASLAEGSAAQILGDAQRSAFLTFENNRNSPADKKRHFAKVRVARDGAKEDGNSTEVELSRWTDDYTSGSAVTTAAASVLLDRLGNINLNGAGIKVNGADWTDTGWVDCTYRAGFTYTNFGERLQVRRVGGIVSIRGMVANSAAVTALGDLRPADLPAGFAPSANLIFAVGTSGGQFSGMGHVRSNGEIWLRTGSTLSGYYSWAGVVWPAG